jgi:hypothetical protein
MEQNHVAELESVALSSIYTLPGSNPFAAESAASMRPLLDSIRKDGVQQPVVLSKRAEGGYYLIDGHRRCCAAYLAHIENVPAHVRDLPLEKAYAARLDANLTQRRSAAVAPPVSPPDEPCTLIAAVKRFFDRGPKPDRKNRRRHRRGR